MPIKHIPLPGNTSIDHISWLRQLMAFIWKKALCQFSETSLAIYRFWGGLCELKEWGSIILTSGIDTPEQSKCFDSRSNVIHCATAHGLQGFSFTWNEPECHPPGQETSLQDSGNHDHVMGSDIIRISSTTLTQVFSIYRLELRREYKTLADTCPFKNK